MSKVKTDYVSELDDLFGVGGLTLGDKVFRVRRVLSREQQRAVQTVQAINSFVHKKIVSLNQNSVLDSLDDVEKFIGELDELQEISRLKCIEVVNIMLLDEIPGLDSLSLESVVKLFGSLGEIVNKGTVGAVEATGFPTVGA